MVQETASPVERSVVELTETAAECVAVLPTAIQRYADGDPAFGELVSRVGVLESRCDERVQSLRRALAAGDPAFVDAYIFGPDVLELAYDVDRIAGATEQFLAELGAIEPDLPPAAEASMAEHARRSAAAADRLRRGVEAVLVDEPCGTEVDAVRAAESACDRLKYRTLADAEGEPGEIVVLRQFVVTLDEVPNAIEDAADRLGRLRAGGV